HGLAEGVAARLAPRAHVEQTAPARAVVDLRTIDLLHALHAVPVRGVAKQAGRCALLVRAAALDASLIDADVVLAAVGVADAADALAGGSIADLVAHAVERVHAG